MPFTLPFSKAICPFCFHEFRIGHAPLRVYSEKNKETDDNVLKFLDLEGARIPMHPVEEIQGSWRRFFALFYYPKIRARDGVVKKRICPACHMTLPTQLANCSKNGDVIAVVGYRNSGKSNFFGVLIDALKNRYSEEIRLNIHALDTYDVANGKLCSSDELYENRYGQYLLNTKNRMAVQATPTATTNPDIRIPLIYRLNFTRFTIWQRILHPFSHHRPLDLILFDAAGEDLDSAEVQLIHARYIARASGIIMLLDPISYPEIQRDIEDKIKTDIAKQFDTFKTVIDAISNYDPHYRESRRIKTPLAVVLSKFDELRPNGIPLEGLDPSVFHDHKHSKGFDQKIVDETSVHLWKFLKQRKINQILMSLEQFSNWKLFGMAALGQAPDANLRLTALNPINIADPLLWILCGLGHIAAKKEKK